MDRAYEGDETRQLVMELNMISVVPPQIEPVPALGLRPRTLQEAQPNRASVSPTERIPPHLFSFRETRRCVSGLRLFRIHRRGSAGVLTRPRQGRARTWRNHNHHYRMSMVRAVRVILSTGYRSCVWQWDPTAWVGPRCRVTRTCQPG